MLEDYPTAEEISEAEQDPAKILELYPDILNQTPKTGSIRWLQKLTVMAHQPAATPEEEKKLSNQWWRVLCDLDRPKVPSVGIFFWCWVCFPRHIVPLAEAEEYGDFLNDPVGHPEYWDWMQRNLPVPPGEYDEFPRGRVVYDKRNEQFTLYADPCILERKDLVDSILKDFTLPENTRIMSDEHYRCPRCMGEF